MDSVNPTPILHDTRVARDDVQHTVDDPREPIFVDGEPRYSLFKPGPRSAPSAKYLVASLDAILEEARGTHVPVVLLATMDSHPHEDHFESLLDLIRSSSPDRVQQNSSNEADEYLLVNSPSVLPFTESKQVDDWVCIETEDLMSQQSQDTQLDKAEYEDESTVPDPSATFLPIKEVAKSIQIENSTGLHDNEPEKNHQKKEKDYEAEGATSLDATTTDTTSRRVEDLVLTASVTADIDNTSSNHNFANQMCTRRASYKRISIVADAEVESPSASSTTQNSHFSINGFLVQKSIPIDIAKAMCEASKTYKPDCKQLVQMIFDRAIKTTFSWSVIMAGATKASLDIEITGNFKLETLNSRDLAVELKLPCGIYATLKTDIFTLRALVTCMEHAMEGSLKELGTAILQDPVAAPKIIALMTIKDWLPECITSLLCRGIVPEAIWPAVDGHLPNDDNDNPKAPKKPQEWWKEFLGVAALLTVAGGDLVSAIGQLGEASAELAAFVAATEGTLQMLSEAIKVLRTVEKPDLAGIQRLRKYEAMNSSYEKVLEDAATEIKNAKGQIREKLNFTASPAAKFSIKDGAIHLDWDKGKPTSFLQTADPSNITWEIIVSTTDVPPSNDFEQPLQNVQNITGATSADIRLDDSLDSAEVHAWVRVNYTDSPVPKHSELNDKIFVSEKWAEVDITYVDEELETKFALAYTLTGEPTLSLSGATLHIDWTSISPVDSVEDWKTGDVKWEVVVSPTLSVLDANTIQEVVSETKVDEDISRFGGNGTLFVHIRAVTNTGLNGLRLEGPWVMGNILLSRNCLNPGEILLKGDYLDARSGELRLILQDDGNLVALQHDRPLWDADTGGSDHGFNATMHEDGNFAIYNNQGGELWSSSTAKDTNAGACLVLQEGGNLVVSHPDGSILWASGTKIFPSNSQKDRLKAGEVLLPGQSIVSPNGKCNLIAQNDGNFVLYDNSKPVWHTDTWKHKRMTKVAMGDDDSLVVHWEPAGQTWMSGTRRRKEGGSGALIIQDDGIAVIKSDDLIIWSTKPELVQPSEPIELIALKPNSDRMRPGEFMAKGQSIRSTNGEYFATLQNDANFVLKNNANEILWETSTTSEKITRLCFGLYPREVALYGANAEVKWTPEREEYSEDVVLLMGNDGNLSLIREKSNPYDYLPRNTARLWSTGTLFPTPRASISSLSPGERLAVGHILISANKQYKMEFSKTGSFNIWKKNDTSEPAEGSTCYQLFASPDTCRVLTLTTTGHLEMKNPQNKTIWRNEPKQLDPNVKLIMQDNGTVVVAKENGDVVWALPQVIGDRLHTLQYLWPSQRLRSANGLFELVYQEDGNFVLYKVPEAYVNVCHRTTGAIWHTHTWKPSHPPKKLILQEDGNLVMYEAGAQRARWSTNTNKVGPKTNRVLVMQDDGNVVLYDGIKPLWWTGTSGK